MNVLEVICEYGSCQGNSATMRIDGGGLWKLASSITTHQIMATRRVGGIDSGRDSGRDSGKGGERFWLFSLIGLC